jgi:RNA polymerase sigma-70 factor (ECF subfamily)
MRLMELPASSSDHFSLSKVRVEQSIRDARNGNHGSLGELFDAARDNLRLFAEQALYADLKQKMGDSDLLQETFLDAQNNFAQFRGTTQAELMAWLRAILANNVLRQYRRYCQTQKRDISREQSFENACMSPTEMTTSPADTPSQIVVRQEELTQVEVAIHELAQDFQHVLRLRHQQGLPFQKIALQMDRTEGAVRQLWYRAYRQLIRILDDSR